MIKRNVYVKKFISKNLFPENFCCLACDIEIFEGELCKDCFKDTVFIDGKVCPVCGRMTTDGGVCLECKAHMPSYKQAVSALSYAGTGSELIARFKNGHNAYLARYLGRLIAEKVKLLPAADCIVYVPMTKHAVNERGYNQAELLAKEVSRLRGIPVLYDAVIKVMKTRDQKNLSRRERLKNLSECFKADRRAVKGKRVLIIDDVMTTGATVEAMAIALKNAGACEVFAACAASVEYEKIKYYPSR